MKAKKAKFVQMVEGRLVASEVAIDNLLEAAAIRGAKAVGVEKQSEAGRIQIREEMVGMPIFDTLLGPMYDGEGVVRYEDEKTYERLSA